MYILKLLNLCVGLGWLLKLPSSNVHLQLPSVSANPTFEVSIKLTGLFTQLNWCVNPTVGKPATVMVSNTVEVVHELSAFTFNDTTNMPGFVNTWVGFSLVLMLDPSPKFHSEANVDVPYPKIVLLVNLIVSV